MKKLTLDQKIAECDIEIQDFIAALKSENRKLQKKVAKLEVENISCGNKIVALEKEIKKLHPIHLSDKELEEKLKNYGR